MNSRTRLVAAIVMAFGCTIGFAPPMAHAQPAAGNPNPAPEAAAKAFDDARAKLQAIAVSECHDGIAIGKLLDALVSACGDSVRVSADIDEYCELEQAVAIDVRDHSVWDAVVALGRYAGFEWAFIDSDMWIVPASYLRGLNGHSQTRIYPVSDLLNGPRSQFGPRLAPDDFASGRRDLEGDQSGSSEIVERWDADLLGENLTDSIIEFDFGTASLEVVGDLMTVTAGKSAHDAIAAKLAEFRRWPASIAVRVETWQITAGAWREVVGETGAGAMLDADAVARLRALPASRARKIAVRGATVCNAQLATIADVHDFHWTREATIQPGPSGEIRAAQTATAALGTSIHIRPTLAGTTGRIVLDASVAERRLVENPNDGTLDLPRARYRWMHSRVPVVDGGLAVLGGALIPGETLPAAVPDATPAHTLVLVGARRVKSADESDASAKPAPQWRVAAANTPPLAADYGPATFTDAPMIAILRELVKVAGVGLMIFPDARLHLADAVTVEGGKMAVGEWLEKLKTVDESDDLVFALSPGGMLVAASDYELGDVISVSEFLDVADLLSPPHDPREWPRMWGPDFADWPGEAASDVESDAPDAWLTGVNIADIVQETIGAPEWDGDAINIRDVCEGRLLVRNTPTRLAEIRQFLDDWRRHRHRVIALEWQIWQLGGGTEMAAGSAVDLAALAATGAACEAAGVFVIPDAGYGGGVDGWLSTRRESRLEGDPEFFAARAERSRVEVAGMKWLVRPAIMPEVNAVALDAHMALTHATGTGACRVHATVTIRGRQWTALANLAGSGGGDRWLVVRVGIGD